MASADARTCFCRASLFNPKPPSSLAMKSLSFPPISAKSPRSLSILHIGDDNYNNYGGGGSGKGGGGNRGDDSSSRSRGGGCGGGGLSAAFFMMGWAAHMAATRVEKEATKKMVLNAVAWVVARMRESSDLRRQTLSAVKAVPVGVFNAMVMALTCLNNFARGMSSVLLGRLMGSQKGGGGGCEGGVMSTSSKSKPKAKRKKAEEEKTFRRAKYFLAAQLVAGLLFWFLSGGDDNAEERDEDELGYDDQGNKSCSLF